MKMKRWISILLTLALCLGLLPAAAATDSTSSELPFKLYDSLEDGTEILAVDGVYNVEYMLDQNKTVYLCIVDNGTEVFDDAPFHSGIQLDDGEELTFVSSELLNDGRAMAITHHSNDSSTMSQEDTVKVGNEPYTINITFTPAPDRTLIYDDNKNSTFTVSAGTEQAFTFPPYVFVGDTLTRVTNQEYTFTCDETIGSLFWSEEHNELGIDTSSITNAATGKIYATSKTDSSKFFTCAVTVRPPHTPTTYPFKLFDAAAGGNLITLDSSGRYVVNVVPGEESIVYARVVEDGALFAEGTSYTILDDNNSPIISSELISSTVLKITHHGNMDSSSMVVGRPLTVGETTRPLMINHVSTSYYPFALYSDADGENEISKDSDGWYNVNVTAGQDTTVYARVIDENTVFADGTEYTITASDGTTIAASGKLSEDKKTLTITIHGEAALTMAGCGRPLIVDGVRRPLNINFMDTSYCPFALYSDADGENEISKDSDGWYNVNVTAGQNTIVYAKVIDDNTVFADGTEYTITTSDGTTIAASGKLSEDKKTLTITIHGEAALTMAGCGRPLIVDGVRRPLNINFMDTSYYPFALYSDANGENEISKDSDGWYNVNVTAGQNTIVYAKVIDDNTVFADGTEYTITTSDGTTIAASGKLSEDKKTLTITIHGEAALTMAGCGRPLIVDGVRRPLNMRFVDAFDIEDLVIPATGSARELKDEEKWPGTTDYNDMGPAEFIYKGETYLVGVGGDNPSFYSSADKDWDEVENRGYHIGYWQTDSQGNYEKIKDSALISELDAAFGDTRTLALYAAEYKGSYPAYYPYSEAETNGMSYTFNYQNSGQWILVLAGTVTDTEEGPQKVVSLVSYTVEHKSTTVYTATDVEAINAYLKALATVDGGSNYTVQLEAKDYYGTIQIEALASRLSITIQGAVSDDGNSHTVLHGGINANAGRIYLKNLELVGCGKNSSVWGKNEHNIDPSTPNYGLYGAATASYDDCTFRDYYIAVSCVRGLRWGGGNTTFLKNRIGLYLNRNEADGGSTEMRRFLFQENDVAIYFENMPTSTVLPMSAYLIKETKFIGNGRDVVNRTQKWFFLPGNYFVSGVGPKFSSRDPFGTAVVSEETTYVSAFPYATNEDFSGLVYDKNAVVSNSLANDWLIPTDNLTTDTTITVIDESSNETAAVWSFGA